MSAVIKESPQDVTSVSRTRRYKAVVPYLYLSPWLIGVLVFSLGPIAFSLYFSFTDFSLSQRPHWIGLQNYFHMANDPLFYTSLKVTLLYILMAVPMKMVVALGVALLLSRNIRGIGIYRTVFYVPSLIGTSVAVSYLWKQIFGLNGLVSQIQGLFGIQALPWISGVHTALFTLSLLQAWTFGSTMLIFVAGLQQIPDHLYESATIDGATRWRRFVHITLPMLSPVVFFNLVMTIIHSFTQFTQGLLVTNGGPMNTTLFYVLNLYNQFTYFKMGYASALAWVLLVIIGIFTLVLFRTSNRWVFYES